MTNDDDYVYGRSEGYCIEEAARLKIQHGQSLRYVERLIRAEDDAKILAHAFTHDTRPPQDVVERSLAYDGSVGFLKRLYKAMAEVPDEEETTDAQKKEP